MKIISSAKYALRKFKEEEIWSAVLRGASSSFATKVIGAATGFGAQVALARLTSLSDYGIYVYVWTWLTVLGMLCTLGFKGALVRFVSEYRETERWGHLQGVLRRSTLYVFACAALVGGLAASGVLYSAGLWENPQTPRMIALGMLGLPFVALNLMQKGAHQGFKSVVWADAPYNILRRVVLVTVCAAIWFWYDELGATEILLVLCAALVISYVVSLYGMIRHLPEPAVNAESVFQDRKWLGIALPFLLISGASLVQNKADILMIGPLVGEEEAGIYGAATRLKGVVNFGLNASNMIVAPMISEYYSSGQHTRMQRLIAVTSAGVFCYTALAGSALWVGGSWALSLFGSEFTRGFLALSILILGMLVNTLAGPVGYVMTMTGNQWIASKAFGVGMVINIVLNAILIPFFGMTGAACATAVSNATWNVILVFVAWHHLDINTTAVALLTGHKNYKNS